MAQITFSNPQYLWYLLSIPLLIISHFYFLRYTKHKGIRFANFEALKRVSGNYRMTKNYTLLFIRILTLACLIIAVSGATYWYQGQAAENDFVLAIDVSASMTAQDIEPTRLEAAREAVLQFIDSLEERELSAQIGVITFSGSTYIEKTMDRDYDSAIEAINDIEVRQEGGTDIAGAVVTATNMLAGSDRGKSMIIISDGSVTVAPRNDMSFENALNYASNEQVVIHTIGMGTTTAPIGYLPEYYNISSIYNEETLLKLSNSTSGTYRRARNATEMARVYEEIGAEPLDTLIDVDLGYAFLLAAIFLVFLEWGLVSTKFRRLP